MIQKQMIVEIGEGRVVLDTYIPVSYTHLDVYKRQVYKVGNGCRASQDLPDCRGLYGEQFSELLKSSRNHVSVLLWSLGSESIWGRNFFLCAQMAKALAPKQLLNFSYPMTIPKEEIIPVSYTHLLCPKGRAFYCGRGAFPGSKSHQ